MPKENTPILRPTNNKEILRGDIYYTGLVGWWRTGTSQRAELWQAIRERRRQILDSPNPREEVDRLNKQIFKAQDEYDKYRQELFNKLTPEDLQDVRKLFRRTPK